MLSRAGRLDPIPPVAFDDRPHASVDPHAGTGAHPSVRGFDKVPKGYEIAQSAWSLNRPVIGVAKETYSSMQVAIPMIISANP